MNRAPLVSHSRSCEASFIDSLTRRISTSGHGGRFDARPTDISQNTRWIGGKTQDFSRSWFRVLGVRPTREPNPGASCFALASRALTAAQVHATTPRQPHPSQAQQDQTLPRSARSAPFRRGVPRGELSLYGCKGSPPLSNDGGGVFVSTATAGPPPRAAPPARHRGCRSDGPTAPATGWARC